MSALLAVLVLLPAATGVGLGLASTSTRLRARPAAARSAVLLAGAVAAAVTALAGVGLVTRPVGGAAFLAGSPLRVGLDGLSGVLAVAVGLVTVAVLAAGTGEPIGNRLRFCGLLLVFLAAVLLTLAAGNLVTLLVGWEVMGATSWALVATDHRDGEAVVAGLTAFLTTRAADLGLYLAAGAALAGGRTGLDRLAQLPPGWRDAAAAGILLAAFGKAAQLPFSSWLSRAMLGPSAVSALLHSAAMVAMGGYLLLRVAPLLAATGWADLVAAWVGAATAVVLGLVAVAQSDLKQLLAASTAAQLGFVALAAGVGGVAGGTAQLLAHAATKSALFLVAGGWLTALGTRRMAALRGAGRRFPGLGVVAGVAGLSLAGVPPLALWAGKEDVVAAVEARSPVLAGLALVAALLSAVYAVRIVATVLAPADRGRAATAPSGSGSGTVAAPVRVAAGALAVAAVALGAVAFPPVGRGLARLVGDAAAPLPGAASLAVAAGLAGLGALLAVRRPGRPLPLGDFLGGALHDWLHLDAAARAGVARQVLALAGLVAAVDDRVLTRGAARLAGGVVATAGAERAADRGGPQRATARLADGSRSLAGLVRRADSAVVVRAVAGVAGGARRLGVLARRPQTGQVHDYLAVSVLGLAAAAALLVVLAVAR